MEGPDLSAMEELWQNLATTEMRLHLMSELLNLKVGLADIEEFNLGLKGTLKNKISTKYCEMQEHKIVKAAMKTKMHDEQITKRKLMKSRNQARTTLADALGRNSKRYRTTIRKLRDAALARKNEMRDKYKDKVRDLKFKYREDTEERLDKIPDEMQDYHNLSIFDREKFERIQIQSYEVTCVGEIHLSNEEKSVLRMHPKFCVMETLKEGAMNFEIELANAKLRIQLHKENDEKLDDTEEIELTQEEKDTIEEEEAKSRQTFDPLTKTFDDRRRRVTDLAECNRVTLPKPLPTHQETMIEMRREIHAQIFKKYKQEKCTKDGEQESNLTPEQQAGLKSLKKKIKDGDIIVLKTDKSGKLCVASRDAYVKMGMIHTEKDKKIGWNEIQEMEKQINGHSVAWVKMHNTGEHHGHHDRVIDSKVSRSKNLSTMYLVVKDHKKEPGKSRPIVTGCSGNTRALSNSVSNLLESVANMIENVFERISSEDMLHSAKISNQIISDWKDTWRKKRKAKLRCKKCDFSSKPLNHCHHCIENISERQAEL